MKQKLIILGAVVALSGSLLAQGKVETAEEQGVPEGHPRMSAEEVDKLSEAELEALILKRIEKKEKD